jgi:hypothetical protein
MPILHERDDDAGVLADRPVALGAHPRVGEDLRDRVLRRRRFLGGVGVAERLDVVERVVVGDVLQRVGDALDRDLPGGSWPLRQSSMGFRYAKDLSK